MHDVVSRGRSYGRYQVSQSGTYESLVAAADSNDN